MYFVSDIPKDKLQNYTIVFQKLLCIFNKICEKIQFKLVAINSLYDSPEEYYIDFLKCFLNNLIFWDSKYDEDTKKRHLNSSYHNLYPFGERDIHHQEKNIQDKYYYYSALMTDAIDCMRERRKFNKNQDKIQLACVKGPSRCINLGACETSAAHFWTGTGCLKINKNKLKPYIYTQSNLEKMKNKKMEELFEVDTEFKDLSKNFHFILFVKE